jgi:hypothetical protein
MGFPSWTSFTRRPWTGPARNEATTSKTPFEGGRPEQEHAHAANRASLQRHRVQVSHRTEVSLQLREIIFSSQRRYNQGVLQHPIRDLRRDPVYQETFSIPTRTILRSLQFHIIRSGEQPHKPRRFWRKRAIYGPMRPVCAPIPTSASSSIKTISFWRTRIWPGFTPRLLRNN